MGLGTNHDISMSCRCPFFKSKREIAIYLFPSQSLPIRQPSDRGTKRIESVRIAELWPDDEPLTLSKNLKIP